MVIEKSRKRGRRLALALTCLFIVSLTLLLTHGRIVAQDSEGASSFTGAWQPSGLQARITLAIKGTVVTGSVAAATGAPAPITSGAVNGNAITFTVESPDNQRTVTFQGTLTGDSIAFTRSVAVHDGGAPGGNGIYGVAGPAAFTAARVATPGSITGRVVDKVSGRPLRKATVTLSRFQLAPITVYVPAAPPAEAGAAGTAANGATPFGGIVGTEARGNVAEPTLPERRTIRRDNGPAVNGRAETAIDGTFLFDNLPPGDYRVTATMDHYLTQEYGQLAPGWLGKLIPVRAAERVDAINFQLTKKGVITGTIVDANGSPMPNVDVQVYNRYRRELPLNDETWDIGAAGVTRISGDVGFIDPFTGRTDDLGRYRLQDLEPNDYFVVAMVRSNSPATAGGIRPSLQASFAIGEGGVRPCIESARQPFSGLLGGGLGLGGRGGNAAAAGNRGGGTAPAPILPKEIDLPVLYPGTTDPVMATMVHVDPGAEIQGIDFTVRPARLGTLTGTVALPNNAASETTPFCANVALLPIGPGADLRGRQLEPPLVTIRGGNTFQFNSVIPGTYRIVAVSGPADHALVSMQEISVQPGGSQALTLALKPVFDVSGRIIADSPPPKSYNMEKLRLVLPLNMTGEIRLLLAGLGYDALSNNQARVNPDGSFVLRNVIPDGRYGFGFAGWEQAGVHPYPVKARYGDTDLPGWGPMIGKNEATQLDLHLGFNLGRIEVVVKDQGKPQPNIVTMLANRRYRDFSSAPREVSDAQGRVTFSNVEPGDYDVYAWENVVNDSWYSNTFMDQFKGRGQFIHVEAGGTSTADVQTINVDRSVN